MMPKRIDLSLFTEELRTLINAKADAEDIPTKTSQLQNDSGFITAAGVPEG